MHQKNFRLRRKKVKFFFVKCGDPRPAGGEGVKKKFLHTATQPHILIPQPAPLCSAFAAEARKGCAEHRWGYPYFRHLGPKLALGRTSEMTPEGWCTVFSAGLDSLGGPVRHTVFTGNPQNRQKVPKKSPGVLYVVPPPPNLYLYNFFR